MKRIFVIIVFVLSNFSGFTQTFSPTTIVKTPMYSIVPNAQILTGVEVPYTPSELVAYEANLKTLYGNDVQVLGGPTWRYNCHAYAWHMSDGGPHKVWINSPGHHKYWQDGTYTKVVGATDITAPNGARVVYDPIPVDPFNPGDHSAVKISTGMYVSKWGSLGLIQHPPNACPSMYNASIPKDFYVKSVPPGFDFVIHNTTQICLSNITVEFRAKVGNNAIAKVIDRDPFETLCYDESLCCEPYNMGYTLSGSPGTPITNMELTLVADYSTSGYATVRADIDGGAWSYSSAKHVNAGSNTFVFNLNGSSTVPDASRRLLTIHIY